MTSLQAGSYSISTGSSGGGDYVKLQLKDMYTYSCELISELHVRSITCRTGSHSATFCPIQVNPARLNPSQARAGCGIWLTYPVGIEG